MKKLLSLFLTIVLLFSMSTAAFATSDTTGNEPELDYVTDTVGLLSDTEWETLEKQAKVTSERYGIGIYTIFVDDYTEYADGSTSDVAKAIYNAYYLGLGENKSGICLLFSNNDGKFAVVDFATATDLVDGQEEALSDAFIDGYEESGMAGAVNHYIYKADTILAEATGTATAATTEDEKTEEAATTTETETAEPDEEPAATETTNAGYLSADLNTDTYVTDTAGTLSDSDREALEARAQELSDEYGCGIYIITVDNYKDYSSDNLYNTAKLIYQESDLGVGSEKSGILLMLSMNDRNYALITYGDGNDILTADGKDWMSPAFVKEFKNDNWADGFYAYLDKAETALQYAEKGKPISWLNMPGGTAVGLVVALLFGAFIAWIVSVTLKGQLESVNEQIGAKEYIAQGGVNITHRDQRLINVQTYRHYIEPKDSGGSSGGGSRSVDSDGFSGKTGSF